MEIKITVKSFLIISGIFFILSGLFYGFFPTVIISTDIDLARTQLPLLRSIMGLYCGIGAFIICGAFIARYMNAALLLDVLCVGGLLIGRLLSFIVDGRFPVLSIICFVLEAILLGFALWYLLTHIYRHKEADE